MHHSYYTAGDDMQRMIAGFRKMLEICAQPALAPYASSLASSPRVTATRHLREHIARTTFSIYHPVGTCRMGEDAAAVVDAELRVNGLEGLRVVDASVMPMVPRGNTNAPTIAVAERAADLIRHGRALAGAGAAAEVGAIASSNGVVSQPASA